jgi:hypothetical protein
MRPFLQLAIESSVLDGLADVVGGYVFVGGQVGDGSA